MSVLSTHLRQLFGPILNQDGTVDFRLWSPSANQVEVLINNQAILMQQTSSGFFEAHVEGLAEEMLYKFRIDGHLEVPDPASRYQPQDIHGPSALINPQAYQWRDNHWKGRPWEEAVLYELHVGTFTDEGTFKAAIAKLDHLVNLGITAIELMPVSDFPGKRNWGYDGVLPYAPDSVYGHPDDLKALVDAAHQKGLMAFLDVVYNHFGPEGNYLYAYAREFFTDKHKTPWGDAINFDDKHSEIVRSFFIENALYWIEEFHFDGLRFDAVHAIHDDSSQHFLEELAKAVQHGPGKKKLVHLVLENDDNASRFLKSTLLDGSPKFYTAQWNDDIHHAFHVLVTDETSGYYSDYATKPAEHLGRCLTQGFSYQGQGSPYRDNEPRGETSKGLPLTRFVAFLQNHDQIGNRAFGERLTILSDSEKLKLGVSILALSPQIPMLFMAEEWGSKQAFPFFCNFEPDLAEKVTQGRRQEFSKFPEFNDPAKQAEIPDPSDIATFKAAVLNWSCLEEAEYMPWLSFYRQLLQIRHEKIVPLLKESNGYFETDFICLSENAAEMYWKVPNQQKTLYLWVNFSSKSVMCTPLISPSEVLYENNANVQQEVAEGRLPGLSVLWLMQ